VAPGEIDPDLRLVSGSSMEARQFRSRELKAARYLSREGSAPRSTRNSRMYSFSWGPGIASIPSWLSGVVPEARDPRR
jgi:hypothetical protein